MQKIIFCLLLCVTFTASGIDWKGYHSAKTLEKEKRYDEAIAVYEKLSDATANEKDDQQYMLWAIAAANSKKDPATAKRLAERVKNPHRRQLVLMTIQKPAEIITAAGNIDFMTYPEDIRGEAFARRGSAYFRLRQYDQALNDFNKALSLPGANSQAGWAARYAGWICRTRKQTEQAEKYFRKALTISNANFAWRNESVIDLSALLIAQKRAADACKIFESVKALNAMRGYWGIKMNTAYAEALISADKKLEALKVLDHLLQMVPEKDKAKIKKQLDTLSQDML